MASAAARRSRSTRRLTFACSLLLYACRAENAGNGVDLLIPDGVGRRVEFVPKTAFAEYVELPELRRELRITLANYSLSCDHYEPPGQSDVLFVLTLTSPAAEPFHASTYPLGTAELPDAGPVTHSKGFAVARQGGRGFDFPGGGSVELRSVEFTPGGLVSGMLALEFPGDGSRPPAGAHGKFEAHLCHGE